MLAFLLGADRQASLNEVTRCRSPQMFSGTKGKVLVGPATKGKKRNQQQSLLLLLLYKNNYLALVANICPLKNNCHVFALYQFSNNHNFKKKSREYKSCVA